MRILWASNTPWNPTGYGMQTAQVVKRLVADGHDVAISANFGLGGAPLRHDGVTVYPVGLDAYGNDAIPFLYKVHADGEPTVIITLYDVWVWRDNAAMAGLPIASWIPVDHAPVPPEVLDFAAAPGRRMLAMSQFGQRELAAAGVSSDYIPHAIETDVFRPSPSTFRQELGVPEDAFLVTVNAANRDKFQRKAWFEMLAAFRVFATRHDDAYIYLHTTLDDPSGISLSRMVNMLRIPPERVRVVDQLQLRFGFIDQYHLAERYSASDVLLAVSRGEGFGIPVVEAQACGTPVIVSDATAQPELCGAGWQVKTQAAWDPTQLSTFAQPLLPSVVESLEAAYAAKGDQSLRDQAVAFAQGYDADLVYDRHWRPVLASLEQWITPTTRQQRRAAARRAHR